MVLVGVTELKALTPVAMLVKAKKNMGEILVFIFDKYIMVRIWSG